MQPKEKSQQLADFLQGKKNPKTKIKDAFNEFFNKIGDDDELKGEKGDPFLYEDFTPEQIEGLKVKGDDGYTPVKGADYFDGKDGIDGKTPVKGVDYFDGKDGIDAEVDYGKIMEEVIKNIPDPLKPEELDPLVVVEKIKQLKGDDRIPLSAIKDSEWLRKKGDANGGFNMNDQRWHGGGLSKVTTDATLTGEGTPASPLSAVSVANDGKVKYDAADPTAGYVADKIIAGTGISVAEGTGANENKLVITNSSPDQTVALTGGTGISTSGTYPNFTITNSAPDQTVALTAGTGISTSGTYPNFTITNSSPSLGGDVTWGGNTNGAKKVIGSNDNYDIGFETNGTEKVTILADGKVGIGTSSPAGNLDILGKSTQVGYGMVRVIGNGTNYEAGIGYRDTGDTDTTSWVAGKNIGLTNDAFSWYYGGVKMVLDKNGNVGIGTTNPGVKLQIYTDTIGVTEALRLQGKYASPGDGSLLRFTNYHVSGLVPNALEYNLAGIIGADDAGAWGGKLLFQTATGGVSGGTVLSTKMTILANGNVGIGTTSPARKLDVNGDVNIGTNLVVGSGIYNANYYAANSTATYFRSSTGPIVMTILENGNVGIGTTSPDTKLEVAGDGTTLYGLTVSSSKASVEGDLVGIGFDGTNAASRTKAAIGVRLNSLGYGRTDMIFALASAGDGNNVVLADEKMRILNNGNVGIGTTTPGTSLHVYRGASGLSSLAVGGIVLEDDVSTGLSILTPDTQIGYLLFASNGDNDAGGIKYDHSLDKMQLWTNSAASSGIVIDTNGNVGIGTTAPGSKLDVVGANAIHTASATVKGILNVASSDAQAIDKGGSITLGGYRDDAATEFRVFGSISGRKEDGISPSSTGYLAFTTNLGGAPGERMRITGAGNVGIGTTGPTYKLHVSGTSSVLNITGTTTTAAAPLVYFADNSSEFEIYGTAGVTNIGPYSDNALAFVGNAGTEEKMRILANGNIGIGTTSPGAKLEVAGGALLVGGTYSIYAAEGTAIGTALRLYSASGVSHIVRTDATGSMAFDVNTGSTEAMRILSSGNVGIGTTAPNTNLDVLGINKSAQSSYGNLNVSASDAQSANIGGSITLGGKYNDAGAYTYMAGIKTGKMTSTTDDYEAYLTFSTSRINVGLAEAMRILPNGNVGIGTTSPGGLLDVGTYFRFNSSGVFGISDGAGLTTTVGSGTNPSIRPRFESDVNTGIGWNSADSMSMIAGGVNVMNVVTSGGIGSVGIGTTAPTSKLHVVGGLNLNVTVVTDTYQVLVTDYTVVCNKATAFTVTLPVAVVGATFVFKNINTGVVTLDGTSTDLIDGQLTTNLNQWESKTLQCYVANNWITI